MSEIPALDAYQTAKPDEPTFTLQGGDPLAAPLIRLWVCAARMQNGLGTALDVQELYAAAQDNKIESNSEARKLLVRATWAEREGWKFDEYRKGNLTEEQSPARTFDEFARLDIWDIRRRCAGLISNFIGELNEYRMQLIKHEFLIEDGELDNVIFGEIAGLQSIMARIEVKK
jgi:hypothetical protein